MNTIKNHATKELAIPAEKALKDNEPPVVLDHIRRINDDINTVLDIYTDRHRNTYDDSKSIKEGVHRLMKMKPLTPLTGEPDEWCDIDCRENEHVVQYNSRCKSVIKFDDGVVVDTDRFKFTDDGGLTWWADRATCTQYGHDCKNAPKIGFPYIPPTHREPVYLLEDSVSHGVIRAIEDLLRDIDQTDEISCDLEDLRGKVNREIDPSRCIKVPTEYTESGYYSYVDITDCKLAIKFVQAHTLSNKLDQLNQDIANNANRKKINKYYL